MRAHAIILDENRRLVVDEVEVDRPKKGEVLIKVLSTGICHTDINVIKGRVSVQLPVVLGHEVYGIAEEVGSNVSRVKAGDYVVAGFTYPCGSCKLCVAGEENLCASSLKARALGVLLDGTTRLRWNEKALFVRNGGWSEYVVLPENSVVTVPENVRMDELAIVGCGVSTAYNAVVNVAQVRAGESIAIFGLGGVGMNVLQFAKLAGASQIIAIDIVDEKLTKAREMGATLTINARNVEPVEQIKKEVSEGVDVAFEAVGSEQTIRQALDSVRVGGRVVLIGLGVFEAKINPNKLVFSGIKVMGCYGVRPRIDIPKVIDLIKGGRLNIKDLVTHKYSKFEDVEQAIKTVEQGKAIRAIFKLS
jgi:succinate semialdehyde reductase (NADPH)